MSKNKTPKDLIILRDDDSYIVRLDLDHSRIQYGYEHGIPYQLSIRDNTFKRRFIKRIYITQQLLNQCDHLVLANYFIGLDKSIINQTEEE